jgi:hypothetical protein
MAKLNFKVTENKDTLESEITVTMTNDVSLEIIKSMKEVFDLEMIVCNKVVGQVEIREAMIKTYFEERLGKNES